MKYLVYLACTVILMAFLTLNLIKVEALDTFVDADLIADVTACAFRDGDNPNDPDNCLKVSNNGFTGGRENIQFTVTTNTPVDNFRCELKFQSGALVPAPNDPNDCKQGQSDTTAVRLYQDLEMETYVFRVVVTKTTDNNNDNSTTDDNNDNSINQVLKDEATFTFTVRSGAGGQGGAGIGGDPSSPTDAFSIDPYILNDQGGAGIGDVQVTQIDAFKNLLMNEKIGFFNLENKLKNNQVINTTSLACFQVRLDDDTIIGSMNFEEIRCNELLIISIQSPIASLDSNASTYSMPTMIQMSPFYSNDLYIHKINDALFNGINGSLLSCALLNIESNSDLDSISCNEIFIAYDISS